MGRNAQIKCKILYYFIYLFISIFRENSLYLYYYIKLKFLFNLLYMLFLIIIQKIIILIKNINYLNNLIDFNFNIVN